MTDLAKLVVRLEAETARYQSELEKAKRQLGLFEKNASAAVRKIATAAGAAAAAAAVGFVAMTKAAIDSADNLNDMSKATGVSVEALSQLQYAAKLSGTDLETLNTGLRKLSSVAFDAAKGVKASAQTFDTLGISVKNADGSLKSNEQLLLEIADVFSQYEDGAAKAALAQDVFGRSGTQLIPFLNQGRKGIEELRAEADRLGITISGSTAAAADEFNDNLTRLKSGAMGLANQVAAQLLPMLNELSGSLVDSSTKGQAFADAATVIATALKLLVSGGLIVAEIFDRVGSAIGAAAAALVAVAQRDFKRAFDIIKQGNADNFTSVAATAKQIAAVWSDAGKNVVATAETTDAALKKSFAFGGAGESPVQEVKITAKKIETNAVDEFNQALLQSTQTTLDAQVAAYNADKAALDHLLEYKLISVEEYNERISESFDKLFDFEPTAKKIKETVKKTTDELTEFQKQAARNTQDIIADALTNGFDDGAKGVLKAFGEMLIELAAQAVAANIAKQIFGTPGQAGDTGGWVGLAANFLGGFADGGRPPTGVPSIVGERGPELFVPDQAGTIVPSGEFGGAMSISNTFVIQTPTGRVPLETQQQVATRAAQSLEQARRRNG